MEPITSSQNQYVKQLRSLMRRKNRRDTGLMTIEGSRFIEDALESGAFMESVLYSDLSDERALNVLDQIRQRGIQTVLVDDKILKSLSDTVTPQGIIAVVKQPQSMITDILASQKKLVVIADEVRDPGNLGTLIRTSAAVGASGVVLTKGTVDPYSSKTLRATMGAIFRVPLVSDIEPAEIVDALQSNGFTTVVAEAGGDTRYFDLDLTVPVCLVVGNEANGPNSFFMSSCNHLASIPMPGGTESLNAAIASSVILFEVLRQRTKTLP